MIEQLQQTYDVEKLLDLYNKFPKNPEQLMITSMDGSTYEMPYKNFLEHGIDENDFTIVNNFFKGTYVETVYKELDSVYNICRARFLKLDTFKRAYSYHKDFSARIHIPLTTNDNCFFMINEELYKMPQVGQAYLADTTQKHSALNLGWTDRIHFVACLRYETDL